jgi:hypothetical protein
MSAPLSLTHRDLIEQSARSLKPPTPRWVLLVHDGEYAHRILLCGPPARLGRGAACEILVDDPRVDAVHLEITPHEGGATFWATGPTGFSCHGEARRVADVAWGVPVFLGDFLLLVVAPWVAPD